MKVLGLAVSPIQEMGKSEFTLLTFDPTDVCHILVIIISICPHFLTFQAAHARVCVQMGKKQAGQKLSAREGLK